MAFQQQAAYLQGLNHSNHMLSAHQLLNYALILFGFHFPLMIGKDTGLQNSMHSYALPPNHCMPVLLDSTLDHRVAGVAGEQSSSTAYGSCSFINTILC